MDYKKFTAYVIVGFFCVSILCFGINYLADSYGLYDTHNKRLEKLVSEKISLYKDRISVKAPCYVVGSSRVLDLDFSMLSKLSDTHCVSMGVSTITLSEVLFSIKQIKPNDSKLWVGFDVFSLNAMRNGYQTNRLQDAFHQNHVPYFLDYLDSLKAIYEKLQDFVLERRHDSNFRKRDSTIFGKNSLQEIEENRFHPNKDTLYANYTINFQEVQELAGLLDSNDVVIIFPKHAHYYTLFDKHRAIKEQYFQALRLLVTTTKARVVSFYGTNEITLDTDNFDDYGWHFKPKIGELIIQKMLHLTCQTCIKDSEQILRLEQLPKNFGVELRPENVDFYLQNLLL